MCDLPSVLSGPSHLDMVDPDQVGARDRDGITAPDVLGVDLGEVDVLDDDVLDPVGHVDALALDDTGGALADQGLVGLDLDRVPGSLVVGDGADGWGAGLVVIAPLRSLQALVICLIGVDIRQDKVPTHVVLVDGQLAAGSGAVRRTSSLRRGSLRVSEVEGLGQDDDTGGAVREVRNKLGVGRGVDGSGRATTGNALGETLSGAGDTSGSNAVGEGGQRRENHPW